MQHKVELTNYYVSVDFIFSLTHSDFSRWFETLHPDDQAKVNRAVWIMCFVQGLQVITSEAAAHADAH